MNLDSSTTPKATKRVILLGMFFVSFLIISNLTAFKVGEIHLFKHFDINFPAALLFFPLTYFFDDVLTEVYGFKMSRLIIWGGLFCSALITVCTWVAVYIPASSIWEAKTQNGNAAYTLVFTSSARIFLASALAYFFGEFLNSILLAKLKVLTAGKLFSLRIVSSTGLGVAIDSIIFCNIAFWGVMPQEIIWKMILTLYLFKLSYEILALPVTYYLTRYLKKVDRIDYYDSNTSFNPFSLSLEY